MQQKKWSFLLAPPHLGAPVLIWTVHQQKYAKHKVQQLHVGETMFAARDSTHISRSPGRPQRTNAWFRSVTLSLALHQEMDCSQLLLPQLHFNFTFGVLTMLL